MRTKGFANACTCHAGLMDPEKVPLRDNNGRLIYDKKFNTVKTKWNFKPKSFKDTKIKLIVLDEAWMAPRWVKNLLDNIHSTCCWRSWTATTYRWQSSILTRWNYLSSYRINETSRKFSNCLSC